MQNSNCEWLIDLCDLDDYIKNEISELKGDNLQ